MRERITAKWVGIAAVTAAAAATVAADRPATTPAATGPAATAPATPPATAAVRHDPVPPPPPHQAATVPTSAPVVQPTPVPVKPPQPPIDPRLLYAMGYAEGRRIHDRLAEDGRPNVDQGMLIQAFIQGLTAANPTYTREELAAAVAQAQAYLLQQQAERAYGSDPAFRRVADENAAQGHALLDRNAKVAGVQVRPDAVQVQVVRAATDPNARAWGTAKAVTLDLRVSLADGPLVSATEAGKPAKVDAADLLPALVDACRRMRVGEAYRVWVPGDRAYGLAGKPPTIGPNQAMAFDVTLVAAE